MERRKVYSDRAILHTKDDFDFIIDKLQDEIDNYGGKAIENFVIATGAVFVGIKAGGACGVSLCAAFGSELALINLSAGNQKEFLMDYRDILKAAKREFDESSEVAYLTQTMIATWDLRAHTYIFRMKDPQITKEYIS